jgi:CheY-like chemotaxis protein
MSVGTKRILCVDDNEDTSFMLATLLRQYGYESANVGDPAEALRLVVEGGVALCILDSGMPGMSGEELCRKIREISAEIPIIFYSGRSTEGDTESGIRAGANAFLVKPGVEEIVPTVQRLLNEAVEPSFADHRS